ncbi:MAG TPA: histidinol-phosphatase [Patescibacteria group bacterium]|nr:histidinol-phosphatase [Patescibacteria group bacterium]
MTVLKNTIISENANVSADLIALAHRLADASGEIIRKYFRTGFHIEGKQDQSPVTIADREAEQAIRAILAAERPDDGIHGEEFGSAEGTSGYLWVLDPVDGTKAFATGRPLFGTLIGLVKDGEAVLGVIDQPISNERWSGAKGHPTLFNGKPCTARKCPEISNANVATTGPDMFALDEYLKLYTYLKEETSFTIYGGDCYSYGTLASGWLDGVVEGHMKLHDYAALIPVVEGAGGIITDWQGKPLPLAPTFDAFKVLATGDRPLHEQLLRVLGK